MSYTVTMREYENWDDEDGTCVEVYRTNTATEAFAIASDILRQALADYPSLPWKYTVSGMEAYLPEEYGGYRLATYVNTNPTSK